MLRSLTFVLGILLLNLVSVTAQICITPTLKLRQGTKILTPCRGDTVKPAIGGMTSQDILSIVYDGQGKCTVTPYVAPGGQPSKPYEADVKVNPPDAESGTCSVKVTVSYMERNSACPNYNVVKTITDTVTYTIKSEEDGGCSGSCTVGTAGTSSSTTGSVHVKFYLGYLDDQTDAGFLSIDAESPSSTLSTAGALNLNFNYPGLFRYPASGTLQQVKSPQVLAKIVDTSSTDYSYTIEFYHSQDVTFNGTYYVPNGGAYPFQFWTIRNPSSNINVFEIAGSGSSSKTSTFTYDTSSSPNKWSLAETGNLQTHVAWEAASGADTDKFVEVRNATGIVRKTKKTYQTIGGQPYLKQLVEGDGTTLTTTYTLITSGGGVGQPSRIDYPGGRWEVFEYDDRGRVLIKYEAYADFPAPSTGVTPTAANGRKTTYSYDALDASADVVFHAQTPRITRELAPIYSGGSWSWVTNSVRFFWTPDTATTKEAVSIRPGHDNCSWTDTDNLVTTTVVFDDPSDVLKYRRTKLIVRPDATGSIFGYSESSGNITTVEKRGELNGGQTAVVTGTETTTVRNALGRTLSVTVKDITGSTVGLTLSQLTYSYSGSALLEDYTVTDLAGRVTTYLHNSCCGLLESVTNPDGQVTEYEYDDLKRRVSTKTSWGASWVKMTNILDAAGRVLVTQRIPSSGSTQTLAQYEYDALGRVTKQTNAWNGVTSYSYTVSTGTSTTTSYPDGGQRIETTYRDGRTKQVSGSAVAGVRYDPGVQAEGTESIKREVLRTVRLDSSGGTNEWTLDVTDDLGRNLRTYYAKASGSPYSENAYNTKGQLVRRTDPDGVSQLYSYNNDGTVYKSAMDLNGDGQIVDNDGNSANPDDRITYQVRDVVLAASSGKSPATDLVRVRTYAYLNNDSSSTGLISTVETSTDGRRSWNTIYRDISGGTPVTTYTEVGMPSSGSRTDTVINPDGSYSEKVYTYGRLTTTRERNSGGTQVTSVTFTYDNYGRVVTQADARIGATAFTYYNADAIQTVTAPDLGTGEPRQVTTSYYDTQGRLKGQLLPDGSTVTNFYHVTGLLQKTYGSRTYPVEYDYDAQGRMKTMKTWQTFNGGAGTAAVTTWTYNAYRGWLDYKDYPNATTGAASTPPGSAGPAYTYTDAGRLLTRVWKRGLTTTYEYKVKAGSAYTAGDLRLVSYSDSTPSTTYTYDRRGRRATALRNSVTTTYAYNEANQPLSESHSGGTLSNLSVVRTYDSFLRLDTLDARRSGTSFQLVGHTYDTAGRPDLVKESNQTTYTAKYAYESNSRLIKSVAFTNNTAGEGLLTSRVWDKLNRLTTISSQAYLNAAGTGNPITFTYQYNLANQRTRADLADGSYWVYQYDSLGQVISGKRYWSDGTLMAGQDFDYKFDEIGNRTETGGRASAVSDYTLTGYPVNHLNQYQRRSVPEKLDILGLANPTADVQVWKDADSPSTATRRGEYFHHALTVANGSYPLFKTKSLYGATQTITNGYAFVPPATEIYSHDPDGNLTADGRWEAYVWDGENRLVEMRRDTSTPGEARQKLTFEYDHLGRRIRKTYFNHNGTAWVEQRDTAYLYDGWNMVAEVDANNSNATLRTYVWGTDLSGSRTGAGGVGGLLWVNNAQTAGGLPTGIQFAAYDGNGNVAGLFAAADGSNTARYEYGPFGEPLRMTGTLAKANPVRWSTKVTDDEGGLVNYGYRYYNPATGRWLGRDPIEEEGGVNITSIIANDPINKYDVIGLIGNSRNDVFTAICDPCKGGPNLGSATRTLSGVHWHIFGGHEETYYIDITYPIVGVVARIPTPLKVWVIVGGWNIVNATCGIPANSWTLAGFEVTGWPEIGPNMKPAVQCIYTCNANPSKEAALPGDGSMLLPTIQKEKNAYDIYGRP